MTTPEQTARERRDALAEEFEMNFTIEMSRTRSAEADECLPAPEHWGFTNGFNACITDPVVKAMADALEFYAKLDWKDNTEAWQQPANDALDNYNAAVESVDGK